MRKRTACSYCGRHARMMSSETRRRRAEVMVEGGFANSPCADGVCEMRPGTDLFTDSFVRSYPIYHIGDDD